MRPRIDKTYSFTRVPEKPSPAFPDINERWVPYLYVGFTTKAGKSFTTPGLLDTGATMTLLGTQWADALGIEWRSCPEVPFVGIGSKNIGRAADLNIYIPSAQYTWPARVVFSEAMDTIPFPLLGYIGFFEHFTVTFQPRKFKLFLQ